MRAERAARRVIELEPDRVTGYHALAQVLGDRREHRAIVDLLTPAIARLEGKEDARAVAALRASLGVAHLQLREFDAGIAAIDRARRDGGADPALDALRVQARLEADRVDEALTVVTEARREDPASQRLLGLEAETRLRRGERDKAFSLYQQSIDADGSDVDMHIAFAGLLLEAKEFKRAETVLTAARTRFPEETSIPFQLGAVFEEQARYEDAERAFRDALAHRSQARAVAQLSGLHAGRARPQAGRSGQAAARSRRPRSLQRLVSRFARLGLLQARRLRRAPRPI